MHSKLNCISNSILFSNISKNDKQQIVPISNHQILYPKGSLIYQPNDDFSGLVIIDNGSAKAYELSPNGKEKILYVLQSGDISGQQYLFTNFNNESIYLEALEDTRICYIKHNEFQNILKQYPKIAISLLNNFGNLVVEFEKQNARRDLLNAEDRLMMYLQEKSIEFGSKEFELPQKKKDTALLLGISPETFSRRIKSLSAKRKITVKGKKIQIM